MKNVHKAQSIIAKKKNLVVKKLTGMGVSEKHCNLPDIQMILEDKNAGAQLINGASAYLNLCLAENEIASESFDIGDFTFRLCAAMEFEFQLFSKRKKAKGKGTTARTKMLREGLEIVISMYCQENRELPTSRECYEFLLDETCAYGCTFDAGDYVRFIRDDDKTLCYEVPDLPFKNKKITYHSFKNHFTFAKKSYLSKNS